ncbi:DUF2807 domain-containing protein [Flavobacterium sp. SOK18b]|uniref:head GIN domain-containing protein n=1 Tax=Flavobacterium sp. SOK18b TaxID=797900 RepID=UPI0015F8F639|nr:head GIN domain-containing protein [Flavobacterium sp. SOK18b]MBB1192716.1 DUF2807 domain-containing protein [Flavobacterium sp. SOK18b]
MLKIITLITKFIVGVLIALLCTSCHFNFDAVEGNGNVTTENRKITERFKSIEVNSGIDVEIEQSDKVEVIVETDENLQEYLTTEVENGTLVITFDKNLMNDADVKKVIVRMPVIDELEATSGATIVSKNTLKGENIRLNTSSAATMDLSIEADVVSCDTSSGSEIKVNGKALETKNTASSGSEINAYDLLTNAVRADVSSGASINVHPIVSLNAEASSGGVIHYDIQPKSIQKNTSSGGSVDAD